MSMPRKRVPFPLGFEFGGGLLSGSIVTTESVVRTTSQEVDNYDFSSSTEDFNTTWE